MQIQRVIKGLYTVICSLSQFDQSFTQQIDMHLRCTIGSYLRFSIFLKWPGDQNTILPITGWSSKKLTWKTDPLQKKEKILNYHVFFFFFSGKMLQFTYNTALMRYHMILLSKASLSDLSLIAAKPYVDQWASLPISGKKKLTCHFKWTQLRF